MSKIANTVATVNTKTAKNEKIDPIVFAREQIALHTGTMQAVMKSIAAGQCGVDAERCVNFIADMGNTGHELVNLWVPESFVWGANQKALMRTLEAFVFISTGKRFQTITGGIVAAMLLTAQDKISFETMRHTMGERGIIDPVPLKGCSAYQLRNIVSRFGLKKDGSQMTKGTIVSQVSRSIGVNGFLSALGVTKKIDGHYIEVNEGGRDHPFILAYAAQMQGLTDGDLGLIE